MKKFTKFNSRLLYSSTLTTLLFVLMIFHSGQVQSQSVTVTSVIVNNPPPTSCTNTNVTVSGMHAYPGFVLIGSSFSVVGFNITVVVNFTQPGVAIWVPTPYSEIVNLGILPVGSYTVTTNGQFNGATTGTLGSSFVVGSVGCCAAAAASFTASANNLSACVGDNIVLTNTSVGSNGTQSWYENGSFLTNNLNYSAQVTTAGPHIYSLVNNGATCSDSTTQTIQVHSYPIVNLGIDKSICDGDNLLLDAGFGFNSYLWSNGSTFSGLAINTSGLYFVDVEDNGCITSDSINISTLPLPQVNLGPDTIICIGDDLVLDATLTGASYLWQDNSTASTFTANDAGLFWVDVTDVNGCSGVDSIQIDTMTCIPTSINDLRVNSNLQTFPNPTKGTLNILVPTKIIGSKAEVKIFKLDGSLMYNQQISSLDHTIKLTLPDVSKGIYLLQLATDGEQWKSKISILE